MTAPDVSIVIPCRDAAETIAATLASCAEQSELPREIILVDDRCRDDTVARARAVARRYRLPLATLETSVPGLGPARNLGYRACQGRFVVWLDADDELLPGALAHLTRLCERHGPRPATVTGNFVAYDVETGAEQVVAQMPRPDALTACLRGKFWVPPGAWLWNRPACERLMDAGGFSSAPRMQDREAFAVALLLGTGHEHSSQVVLRYRMAPGQLSQAWPRHRYAEVLRDIWSRLRTVAAHASAPLGDEVGPLLDSDFRVWCWAGPRPGRGLVPAEVHLRDGRARLLGLHARMCAAAALALDEPFYADLLAALATRMFPEAEDDYLAVRNALDELVEGGLVKPAS